MDVRLDCAKDENVAEFTFMTSLTSVYFLVWASGGLSDTKSIQYWHSSGVKKLSIVNTFD